MLTLAAADTLSAVASAADSVTCTIFGMELEGTTETYKVLDQRQVPASATTLYTVPADTTAFVRSITLVNTDTVNARTVQLFRGGTAAANAITPVFNLAAGGSTTYVDGQGWSDVTVGTGTTLGNAAFTGYLDWSIISPPSAPAADTLRVHARKAAGRVLPKWIGPAGVDTYVQPALFGNNVVMYTPTSGTTVTGGFGTLWAKASSAGTVSHPTPATTSPAVISQMKRTRHANAATTQNQVMGIISTAAGMPQFWRGDAAGLGGFFMFVRFVIALWPANTVRLFVGLTPGTAEVAVSDTVANNTMGLWHDTTDGANVLSFVTRDAATTTKASITGATLAAGQGFDFYMYARPNGNEVFYRLDSINDGTTLVDTSTSTTLPTATVFLGPQVTMSNGTANTTVTTTAIEVNRIYIESDR